MANSRNSDRRKSRLRPVPRPDFKPCWSEQQAIVAANSRLALDARENVGFRLALLALAKTPESLMRGALSVHDDGDPAKVVLDLLVDVEQDLKARLEAVRAAQTRILWAAAYVHGVSFPA